MTTATKKEQKQQMVTFIKTNGGQAHMNMKYENVEAMYNNMVKERESLMKEAREWNVSFPHKKTIAELREAIQINKEDDEMQDKQRRQRLDAMPSGKKVKLENNTPEVRTTDTQPQQPKEAVPTMQMTQDEIKALINTAVQQATAPLIEQNKALAEELKAYKTPKVETQETEKVEAPVQAAPAPQVVTQEIAWEEIRKREAEMKEAKKQLTEAYKSDNDALIEIARKNFDAKLAYLRECQTDMRYRDHAASYMYKAAESTRRNGHKAVDAVANVMHKGVDMVANGMEATGRVLENSGKKQVVVQQPQQA